MRVLVTGAYGLIGSAVLARLSRDGHELVAAGRDIRGGPYRAPFARWIEVDFGRLSRSEDWKPLLDGIEAIVNCVGALQDGSRDRLARVQAGTSALFAACGPGFALARCSRKGETCTDGYGSRSPCS